MPAKKTEIAGQHNQVFGEFTQVRQFKRNAVILRKNRTENHIYFLLQGTVGIFLEKDGEEICYAFVFENSYFSAYESFVKQTPSQVSLKALEPVVLASITHEQMLLVMQSAEGLQYGKQIADGLFFGAQRRIISLITQSAEERYMELLQTRPEVFEKIKQKYIAAYLGITPVSLSRIRSLISARK
jgi:CRP-like cAMP-binding protein